MNRPGLKPSARAASRPATAPAVSVIGSTAARVSTSHFDTTSRRPAGGFVVRNTSRHRVSSPGDDDGAVTSVMPAT